jgi:hypothetical protein
MSIRPRTKLVMQRKSRRCPKCGAAVNSQRTRCKKCSKTVALPKK